MKWLLVLTLLFNQMGHTPRNIQAPNVAADFWAQYNSTNPRVAMFVLLTPKDDWTGASPVGFTSNSRDMTLPGHVGVTFHSAPGITPTVVEQSLGGAASIELTGVYQTGIFEREDVLAGKWSFASVEVFTASWQDTDLGELVEFVGHIGEIRDYGTYFTAEGRGMIGRLSNDTTVVTQRLCRVRDFGNTRCGKVLSGTFTFDSTADVSGAVVTETAHGMRTGEPVRVYGTLPTGISANTTYWINRASANTFKFCTSFANALAGTGITLTPAVGTATVKRGVINVSGTPYDIKQLAVDGIGSASGGDNPAAILIFDTSAFSGPVPADSAALAIYGALFKNGKVTALDGPNEGISREIATMTEATGGHPFGRIELKRKFPFPIDTTTSFDVTMGCVRTIEACRSYNNADRFDAEPYVPGIEPANRITSGN